MHREELWKCILLCIGSGFSFLADNDIKQRCIHIQVHKNSKV